MTDGTPARSVRPGAAEVVSSLPGTPVVPMSLRIGPLAGLLNAELADDPVYDGVEVQWFDDDLHGTGMLAFLSRRDDQTVDYYVQPGLRLDPRGYEIGAGARSWTVMEFEVAEFVVAHDGVAARARFTDVDGRLIELHVDDRDGVRRRRARLLAPVSAGVLRPTSLLLVWMNEFDLVRVTGTAPLIRIGGRDAAVGRLPGARLHRRHLIKYAASVVIVELNPDDAQTNASDAPAGVTSAGDGCISAVVAAQGGHTAEVQFRPAIPDLRTLADGPLTLGRWAVTVDGAHLTGGTWSVTRAGDEVDVALDGLERWRPGPLPWLMAMVTTVVPVFRRWPTTYTWRGKATLGAAPSVIGRWRRTGGHDGHDYRRATSS
jgi:hypothetical protein